MQKKSNAKYLEPKYDFWHILDGTGTPQGVATPEKVESLLKLLAKSHNTEVESGNLLKGYSTPGKESQLLSWVTC